MKQLPLILLFTALQWACSSAIQHPLPREEGAFEAARRKMVEEHLEARGIRDLQVLRAMRSVPRHLLLPRELRSFAYEDQPLPIGNDQTISQPYVVALMTQLAQPDRSDRALEVGTGSGYQAAVLAEIVEEVYTIEIVPELARRARRDLESLGYENIHFRIGDGYAGWPEKAPFDLILVTAAPPAVPQPLKDQLAEGGRLIIPVGPVRAIQELMVLENKEGRITERSVLPVRFVPMTGQAQEGDP